MIRVLQVVTHMNRGGLETMLMNFYRSIDRERVQFDFLTHRPYDGDYGAEIQQMGGNLYHLPVLNPFSLLYQRALSRFFADHPAYQIVHVHLDCLSTVILKVAKQHGVPVRIAHCHSSSQDKNLKSLIKLFYRRHISDYATDLFACSKAAGKWMFCGAPFLMLNNAIDAKKYVYSSEIRNAMRTDLGIPEKQLVLGHVGRFCSVKNHTFLLDIFAALIAQGTDAMLLLVGDGELRTQIEEKAAKLGLSNRIIFTGIRSDISDLLQTMDVFLFPSLYEGLPVSLVEAQAAGLPCCVSSNVPKDAAITDLVEFISLEKGPEHWAKIALRKANAPRSDMLAQIQSTGFDVQKTAKWLEEYYSSSARNI